jgi:tetratricopeptide (TPR) repeat protein
LKPQPSRPPPSGDTAAVLGARGAEALRLGRFRDAVECFKQAVRQDPQSQWRAALAEAYAGRARELAAKGMFKEAAVVLENTRDADGAVAAPLLYLGCLLRQGQTAKAAREVQVQRKAAAPDAAASLDELAAALSLAVPEIRIGGDAAWAAWQRAAQAALHAWQSGAPAETVEAHLAALPLRSPFRPLRLIMKALTIGRSAPETAAELLARVPPSGPFGHFAAAARAALGDAARLAADWTALLPAQRRFVAEWHGVRPEQAALLERIEAAERLGPAGLLALLLRRPAGLPDAALRAACVELLVQVPSQIGQVERVFGPLGTVERERILALAAEAKQDFAAAEHHWRIAAEALAQEQPGVAEGVVYRHLADLLRLHDTPRHDIDQTAEAAGITYLERSRVADPAHLPTALRLLDLYRAAGRSRAWYAAVDRALADFPAEPAVLGQAVDAAVERKAFKKAAGCARTVLRLDPINQVVRQRMIGLQIAQARRQMRADRPDLAERALAEAAEWQRADAPDAGLAIAGALVGLRLGQGEAERRLAEAVRLGGGGVPGWFQATLEATLMGTAEATGAVAGQELARAVRTPADRAAVDALVSLLDRIEGTVGPRVLAPLLQRVAGWLESGARLDWAGANVVAIAETLRRLRLFRALGGYAREAARRTPRDVMARFFMIVAAAEGDARRLTEAQEETLQALLQEARDHNDPIAGERVFRFLNAAQDSGFARPLAAGMDDATVQKMIDGLLPHLPDLVPHRQVRRMVNELGRDGAIESMEETLQFSPLGVILTPPQMRRLAEQAVAAALTPHAKR